MSRPNAFEAQFPEPAPDEPSGYATQEAPYGEAAGGKDLSVRLFEIPPANSICPYHYEYVEEWLIVMAGEVQVRTPSGTDPARAGDVVCFPTGPAGAHKVTNESSEPARVIMFSRDAFPGVAVYPDSDKVGVWTGHEPDEWRFRRGDGKVEYFDGEV